MKRIAGIALSIVLGLLLLLNITLLCMRNAKGYDLITALPWALIRVSGGSMEPELHEGNVVLVTGTPYEELETGDVILFTREERLVIHRIVAIEGDRITTKGTANDAPDAPITEEEYRGRMARRIPLLGTLMAVADHPLYFIIYAVLLVLLIFGDKIFGAIYTEKIEKTGR